MTINTWRNDILNICRYCGQFVDRGKNRHRYQCWRHKCSIYDAHKCRKTFSVRKQASEISRSAVHEAFLALTGKGWGTETSPPVGAEKK